MPTTQHSATPYLKTRLNVFSDLWNREYFVIPVDYFSLDLSIFCFIDVMDQ